MTVRLTRIYTKTGDAGQTHLGDMSRVTKTDPRLVAYADVDETNSVIGVALALGSPAEPIAELLRSIQNDLFDVGADLSTPIVPDPGFPPLRITAAYTERLEAACDSWNADLPTLASFILPGGTPAAALLHQARVVARRAERSVWALLAADADRALPQPAVGPAVHPRPRGQPGRRRPVGAGRAQRRARPASGQEGRLTDSGS
jgi:cob(I)alamin adenosyltransferase